MDTNHWRPPQVGEPAMDSRDWRSQLQTDSRQRIVNKIMDTLKRHLPFSGQEGLQELKKIAVRFEEKIYTHATSQSDYLRKISLKMLTMETKSQNPMAKFLQSNSASDSNRPPDPASLDCIAQTGHATWSDWKEDVYQKAMQQKNMTSLQQSSMPSLSGVSKAQQNMMNSMQPSSNMDSGQGNALNSLQQGWVGSIQQTPVSGPQQAKMNALSSQSGVNMNMLEPNINFLQSNSGMLQHQHIKQQQEQQMFQNQLKQQFQHRQIQHQMIQRLQILQQQEQQLLQQQQQLQQQLMAQQSNISNTHQQQFGSQSNATGLQQQPVHLLQQPKVQVQQQQHQSASNLLPTQGQQSQPQASQQQLSQLQSQPTQMQQQSNPLQQQDMQQRIQASGQVSGAMLQPQNLMDQQKQLCQPERPHPETSSTSLDSTAQTGHASGGDWQEEVYQKIKLLKEMYLPELCEMYQKIATKLQQHDSLPQQPESEQLRKLKMFKTMLERLISVLQISKNNVSPGLKYKLVLYEKQIVNFINTNRPRNPVSSLQQGQLPPPYMHSMQQSQSQIPQVQSHESQMNPQLQSMNLQGSMAAMQQNNMTSLQQSSMPSLSGVSTAPQYMMNSMHPSSNMDSGQGNALYSLQQGGVGFIEQTPVSAPQQENMNALSSQSGVNVLQPSINSLQSNSDTLQHQHIKEQQEQQMFQNQLKQQFQHQQIQHQMIQKQQILQQQQQQQQRQQQQLPAQLQTHQLQMPLLHQMNDVNDLKIREMGVKPGVFQQHLSAGQRSYPHLQLKSGSQFPISSTGQLLQAATPQISQHSSPQVDQQNLLVHTKAGTPLQTASSPFVIPSRSTPIIIIIIIIIIITTTASASKFVSLFDN